MTAIAKSPSDGSLWIGTEDEGILRIGRKGNRIHYSTDGQQLPSNNIQEICFVSESRLYILDETGGLTSYSSTEGFLRIDKNFKIRHILPGPENGQLLFATESGELYERKESSGPRLLEDFHETIAALTTDASGAIYVAGAESGKIQKFSQGRIIETTTPLSEQPTCLLVLQEGKEICVGTGQGLYLWKDAAWTQYTSRDGMSSNRVKCILSDDAGSILIATSSGVEKVNVSNPNVLDSKLYFEGESFLCGSKSVAEDTLYYFGGVRGIASIASHSASVTRPWGEDPKEEKGSRDRRKFPWTIPEIILILAVLAYVIVRSISRHKTVKPYEPAQPVVQHKTHKSQEKQIDEAVPVVSAPPSREEIFAAVEKLEKGDAPEFSLKVWEMIEESYTDPEFTVANIASRMLLTRVHVNRKLQQEINVSPSAVLKAKRMIEARSLIQQGGLTLPQVAQQAGFSSAAYLSASFKEYFGMSPSECFKS